MKNAVFPMLAALVVFSFMSFGCANPADEMVYNYFYTLSNQEEAESLCYIKYDVTAVSISVLTIDIKIQNTTEEESFFITPHSSSMGASTGQMYHNFFYSTIIGPVDEGFIASINTASNTSGNVSVYMSISISNNKENFVLKKANSGTGHVNVDFTP